MITHTQIPVEKLTPWYYAVMNARITYELRIQDAQERGLLCSYDKLQLEALVDMEETFLAAWNTWMEDLGATLVGVGK